MAHKPKIDQNFAPSIVTLGDISPQAITRRQIELESCSNPRKTREGSDRVFSIPGSKIRVKKP